MAKEFTGGGDPRRSIELLWGRQEPGRRGPKQRLSTAEVVAAAIALADTEGLTALSMRRVAEVVGVSPMALYTYVPSKSELLDLMFDRALGETADPDDALPDWRAKLSFIARQRWALTQRHPWLLDLGLHRPPLGPNMLRKAETTMRALDGMGLGFTEMDYAADVLQNYVNGALQSAREAHEVERRSGITDAEWLSRVEPALQEHFDAERFPSLKRMGDARKASEIRPGDPAARFAFGLERVLDGLEAFIGARRATT